MTSPKRLDLTCPSSFLDPATWPDARGPRDATWILSLELAVHVGGPFRRWLRQAIQSGPFIWRLQAKTLLEPDSAASFVVRDAIQEWLRWQPHALWIEGAEAMARRRDLEVEVQRLWSEAQKDPKQEMYQDAVAVVALQSPEMPAPSALEWAKSIFPSLAREVGDVRLQAMIKEYFKQFPEGEAVPFDGFRYFPAHLRRIDASASQLAALDLARLSAFCSLQDEELERKSLLHDTLMVNPTLQTLQVARSKNSQGPSASLVGLVRNGERLIEREIHWQEAAVLDEVAEEARIERIRLLVDLEAHHGQGSALTRTGPFEETIETLLHEGFLLIGD